MDLDYPRRLGDKLIAKAGDLSISVEELGRFVVHNETYVRASVAVAFGILGSDSGFKYLEALLNDEDPHVIGSAAEAAMKIDPEWFYSRVEDTYVSNDRQTRLNIINVLGEAKVPGCTKALKKLHQEEKDPELIMRIGNYLGEIERKKGRREESPEED